MDTNQFLAKVLEWPVIVQGVLGSFLFWIIFKIGEKFVKITSQKIKTDQELGMYWGKSARNLFYKYPENLEAKDFSYYSFFVSIYGALHYFLKFIIIIFISNLIEDFIPVFAYVGYIIALYFIFRSISYVTHFDVFDKQDAKDKEQKK